MGSGRTEMRVFIPTAIAMIAFAANSVLCRLALGTEAIDAGSFTAIRLGSGAAMLLAITAVRGSGDVSWRQGSWWSASMLFLYAAAFSFAYLELSAGTGALLLFGAVQITMLSVAIFRGERPPMLEWAGLALAMGGLIYLMFPGLTAPSPFGAGLMALSGIAWGIYSLRGSGSKNPLAATAGNFIRSVPFAIVAGIATIGAAHVTTRGAGLAVLSGAITSGLGYAIWYAALRNLTATRAALVQLTVPVIAALGGVVLLAESISARLFLSAALTLGGIALAVIARQRPRANI